MVGCDDVYYCVVDICVWLCDFFLLFCINVVGLCNVFDVVIDVSLCRFVFISSYVMVGCWCGYVVIEEDWVDICKVIFYVWFWVVVEDLVL